MATRPTRYGLFIDGDQVEATAAGTLDVTDPATGETWAQVPDASAADVDAAVRSAHAAFTEGPWPRYRAADRAGFLIRFGQLAQERADELAELQVRENGKLHREMYGQTKLLREYFEYYAGLAYTLGGSTNQLHVTDMVNYTGREPLGVVAAITPWNSPLLLLAWKLGPALAAGNTVVAKPSEVTPVSTVRFAELAVEAGLPRGVFNVVTGLGHPSGTALTGLGHPSGTALTGLGHPSGTALTGLGHPSGTALTGHRDVAKIAFTGSTATGQAIAAEAGKTLKRVSLELGGKSPNIVFDDADLDGALNGIVAGILGASGQTCMAGSRILVQDGVYDEVVKRLAERADAITVGDPRDPATEHGTIASQAQYEKVLRYVEVAKADGAKLVAGGGTAKVPGLEDGLFVRPTVFADVTNDMRIAREEVFGPVAAVLGFRDEDEAVAVANDTEFGLAAGVWTGSVQRAHRVAARLHAGTVWINNYRKSSYATPFGGYKQSGLGRENGRDALLEYTEEKSVWVDTGQGVKDPFNPRA
ncbi:MAG: aldehyde dehydrogenase family protein [Streptosporangiales bacterium]|nr:aldehyde dehydrogenase family protein [Streptosporangiales bacterium]